MKNQEGKEIFIELPPIDTMTDDRNRRFLRDFALLEGNELQMSIARSMVNTNNFEFKLALI